MPVAIVQAPADNHSTVNSPASLVCSWPASTAGTFLLLTAVVTGTSPSITTPGGWTLLGSSVGASIAAYMFCIPNNAGGNTGVTLTCSATNGGITASLIEFSGVGATITTEYSFATNGNSNAVPSMFNNVVTNSGDLCLCVVANDPAVSFSSGAFRSSEWAGSVNGGNSSGANTNVKNNNYWAVNYDSGTPFFRGTLSGAALWAAIAVRILSTFSGSLTNTPISGNMGTVVGTFFQGMVGG